MPKKKLYARCQNSKYHKLSWITQQQGQLRPTWVCQSPCSSPASEQPWQWLVRTLSSKMPGSQFDAACRFIFLISILHISRFFLGGWNLHIFLNNKCYLVSRSSSDDISSMLSSIGKGLKRTCYTILMGFSQPSYLYNFTCRTVEAPRSQSPQSRNGQLRMVYLCC